MRLGNIILWYGTLHVAHMVKVHQQKLARVKCGRCSINANCIAPLYFHRSHICVITQFAEPTGSG